MNKLSIQKGQLVRSEVFDVARMRTWQLLCGPRGGAPIESREHFKMAAGANLVVHKCNQINGSPIVSQNPPRPSARPHEEFSKEGQPRKSNLKSDFSCAEGDSGSALVSAAPAQSAPNTC